MREWGARHAQNRKKKKEDVGMEKEREKEEGEKLASFFGAIYEFFNPVPVPIPIPVPAPVPVIPVGHLFHFSCVVSCYSRRFICTCVAFVIIIITLWLSYVPITSIGRPEAANTRARHNS